MKGFLIFKQYFCVVFAGVKKARMYSLDFIQISLCRSVRLALNRIFANCICIGTTTYRTNTNNLQQLVKHGSIISGME